MPTDGTFGISFEPTDDEQRQKAIGGSPLQQAIQVLSLRVPRVLGSRSPIPAGILAGSPEAAARGGGPMGSMVEAILRRILGGDMPGGMPGPEFQFFGEPGGRPVPGTGQNVPEPQPLNTQGPAPPPMGPAQNPNPPVPWQGIPRPPRFGNP